MRARSLCGLFVIVLSVGCDSDDVMVVDAANDAGIASLCEHIEPGGVGVASASFGAGSLRLEPNAELGGASAAAVVESKVQGLGGLVAHRGGVIALGATGFWDVEPDGRNRWLELGSFVTGAAAGDVDGDGDQDAMIVSFGVEVGRGIVAHLLIFERTAGGLVQRAEVRESGIVIGMPFVFYDVDDDDDLDIVTHENGALIAYVNDAFAFERQPLGEPLEGYTDSGALAFADLADRDHDGAEDLLFVIARAGRESGITVIEHAYVVLLGDGEGGFEPAIVSGNQETTAAGLNIADVTGDGISDVITQQGDGTLRLHLVRSIDATRFAAPIDIEPGGAGIQFADADGDGTRDIITTLEGDRLVALIARADNADGAFELRELGIELNASLLAFTGEPASDGALERLHVLYQCPGATDGGGSL